jgi:hypothetical protein
MSHSAPSTFDAHDALLLQGKCRDTFTLLGGDDSRLDGGNSRNQHEGCGWRSHRQSDDVDPRGIGDGRLAGGEARCGQRVRCCAARTTTGSCAVSAGGGVSGRGQKSAMKGGPIPDECADAGEGRKTSPTVEEAATTKKRLCTGASARGVRAWRPCLRLRLHSRLRPHQ